MSTTNVDFNLRLDPVDQAKFNITVRQTHTFRACWQCFGVTVNSSQRTALLMTECCLRDGEASACDHHIAEQGFAAATTPDVGIRVAPGRRLKLLPGLLITMHALAGETRRRRGRDAGLDADNESFRAHTLRNPRHVFIAVCIMTTALPAIRQKSGADMGFWRFASHSPQAHGIVRDNLWRIDHLAKHMPPCGAGNSIQFS